MVITQDTLYRQLDTADGLLDSTPLLENPERLQQRWNDDGVLYFRGVVDPEAIAAVRENYLARLKEVGVVDENAIDPIWNGINKIDGKAVRKIDDEVWQALVTHPSFDRVIRTFLGETPAWVPIVVHRASPPLGETKIADIYHARHQDGVFNLGVEFITCWVPLMDIDDTVGGLAVVPGSHKRSFYDYGDNLPGRAEPIPAGKIADALWRRPDYRVGDILMFHGMTAHAGLPNSSDRFRLSIDVRYVPGSDPKPIVGTVNHFDGSIVDMTTESGEGLRVGVDDSTMVRGPKGSRVVGEEMSTVLFQGANVIAMPDAKGHAKLVRSVSRKYVDLPASWFTELPAGWVK